ncbi:hypothetical protein, partial [Bacteroides thetaiotaomicron]|uniref:hypothetical protein n=2 Tax=Bacteroides thetaiotaomicron TaxID=818 RepID=UPI0022211C49
NEFFFTHFLHSLFSGKDRDLKIQRQRVLYRGLTFLHSLFSGKDRDLKIQRQRVLYRGLTFVLAVAKVHSFWESTNKSRVFCSAFVCRFNID